MTYIEFITNIIATRGQWNIPLNEYKEQHHIMPKCMGGLGDFKNKRFHKNSYNKNCIWLYPKEHFIAHRLLAIENPTNYHIVYAFMMMCGCTAAASNKRTYEVTEEDYQLYRQLLKTVSMPEEMRKKLSEVRKGKPLVSSTGEARLGKHYYTNGILTKMFFADQLPDDTWKPVIRKKKEHIKPPKIKKPRVRTEELNKQVSMKMKQRQEHWYTNGTLEIKCKEEECPKGYYPGRSPLLKQHNSKVLKARPSCTVGEKNGMFGKHHSDETKQKIGQFGKGRKWYNNGKIEVFTHECPDGFELGMLKHWYTNDIIEVFQVKCPKGFHLGRLAESEKKHEEEIIINEQK